MTDAGSRMYRFKSKSYCPFQARILYRAAKIYFSQDAAMYILMDKMRCQCEKLG